MVDWILSIGTIIIITTLILIILPEGKMGDYVKGMLSILIISVIIKPMFTIVDSSYDIKEVFNQNVIVLQDDFLDFTNDKKVQNMTEKCIKIIEEIGIEDGFINIDYFVGENNQIVIKEIKVDLRNSVIISNKEHIDIIEDIKTVISKYLNVQSDRVVIYE